MVGISLGLIGAGGSILTVPVLVYLLNVNMVTATTFSLFIVGITSFAGAIKAYFDKQANLKVALIFGVPSLIAAFIVHKWFIPWLPHQFFKLGSLMITKELFLLLLFAIVMIIVAIRMIRPAENIKHAEKTNYPKAILYGVFIGIITGLLGAGGGFLIIPALVLLLGLTMKNAIGTSLVVITINTLITFAGSIPHTPIDWKLLLTFSGFSIAGIFVGLAIGKKIPGEKLKPAFGWFILLMGVYIITRELFL